MKTKLLSTALIILAGFAPPNFASAQSGCAVRPAGLISWWPGNDNPNDVAGTNHATLINGATFAPGKVGQAFSFDGVDDYVQAASAGLPSGNSDRTLELWAKVDAFVAEEAFFAGYGTFGRYAEAYVLGTEPWAGEGRHHVFFSQWGDNVRGHFLEGLELNRWYHIAVTSVGDFATVYVDGKALGSGTIPINTPSGTHFYMGRIPGVLGETRRLQGQVDEVAIYDRALADSEIAAIYDAGSAGKCIDAIIQPGQGTTNGHSTLRVRAWIDGRSQLVLRPDSIRWDHFDWNRPGIERADEPTYLELYPWYPVWEEPARPWPSFPLSIQTTFTSDRVRMEIVSARYGVRIVQQPDVTNDQTLVVEFNDNLPGGAAWYEVVLSGVSTFFTLPALRVIRSGDTLLIAWPASVSDAVLEMTDAVPATMWVAVPTPPVVIGDENAVTVDIESQMKFFRLRKP